MDLGCFLTPYFPGDASPAANADALLRRAERCRAAGYDYVEVGDHHVTRDGQFLQNVPTAGRLAGVFDRVAVLFLLPLYHPVFVAEYLGTIGAYVDRLDLWCAVGGNEDAFDALGVPMDERAGRFEECLTVVERLLAEDAVTFEGDHFTLDEVSVRPRAAVRVCVGGLARPAVERAGRRGDAWVVHPSESVDDVRRKVAWYRDAGGDTVVARRDALVLADADAARERAAAMLHDGYRGWPEDADWPVVGGPDDVAEAFDRLRAAGVDEVVVGAMDHEHAVETLEQVAAARER